MKWERAFLLAFMFVVCVINVHAQLLQTLCTFAGTNGANPYAALIMGTDGNYYGTTQYGGVTNSGFPSGMGAVFKVTTNGTLTMLCAFNQTNGANPCASLALGNDGNFYGTTSLGGTNGYGSVFSVTTNGVLSSLSSFANTNGAYPQAGLTLGDDGYFYGTTVNGGATNYDSGTGNYGYGVVFRIATNGTLTTLALFSKTNGDNPSGLTLGNDGNFYGTTLGGGYTNLNGGFGDGTIFRVATNGMLESLFSFSGTNGFYPQAGLTFGLDGNFYGTTSQGGSGEVGTGQGTVFKVTTNGSLTTIIGWPSPASFNGANGAYPQAALTLGGDANYYGTTVAGGSSNSGAVFQVTTNGTISLIASLGGVYPNHSSLMLGNDGTFFYGTTQTGGSNNFGTVFRLSIPPAVTVEPQSQTNEAGTTVTFLINASGQLPFNYQWLKNGTNLINNGNITGANANVLTIATISDNDAATYSVILSNVQGIVVSSNATLSVDDFPLVVAQPLSQTIGVGSNVTFTATAYGAAPLIFQWYYGNTPVGPPTSGTNFSSYTLMNVQTNQSGIYNVQVINPDGSVTSSNAILTVRAFPPGIGTQPLSQRVMIGSNAAFIVSAGGTAPFFYQWRFNGTNILNATNAGFTILSVSTNNTGNYSVVVTNLAGSLTSSNALLTVVVPPTMALRFLAGYPVVNLSGMLSNNFLVQYSTNLGATNWIVLLSLTNLSFSPYQFLDPAGSGQPARFYRAVME
jgi:uncharacterized repeat protein (TIGR03803 family)